MVIAPGIIAAKIQLPGKVQKATKNAYDLDWLVVRTYLQVMSNYPILKVPKYVVGVKRTIEIAAAYSFSPILTSQWKK